MFIIRVLHKGKYVYEVVNESHQKHSRHDTRKEALRMVKSMTGDGLALSSPEKSTSLVELLQNHGTSRVSAITALREPVQSKSLLNIISLGQLQKNMDKVGYDVLFHTSLNVELEDGYTFNIEKHDTVVVGPARSISNGDEMTAIIRFPVQLQAGMDLLERIYGKERLYRYNPLSANCQMFSAGFLSAFNGYTPRLETFIKQDSEAILQDMNTYFYQFITDLGRKYNRGILK